MQIDDTDRDLVVRTLAKALPSWEARADAAAGADLADVQLTGSPEQAWRVLVDEAISRDKLETLVRSASRVVPLDVSLKYLAASVEAGHVDVGGTRKSVMALVGLAVVLLAAGVTWRACQTVDGTPRSTVTATTADEAPLADATTNEAPKSEAARAASGEGSATAASGGAPATSAGASEAASAGDRAAAAPSVPTSDDAAGKATQASASTQAPPAKPAPADAATTREAAEPEVAEPKAAAQPAKGTSSAPAASATPPSTASTTTSAATRASGAAGGCEGWAWMGDSTSLEAGDVWSVPTATYVRADYPRAENGWNSRTASACVLNAGDTVKLSVAPVYIPGGAYWARVVGGSITR